MRYDYSVVRFVPDSFRAEFVNVGVIVGSAESGEWLARRVSNAARARGFRNGTQLGAVWDYLDRVDELLAQDDAAGDMLGNDWLIREHRRLQNLVQLSRPQPVLADSVDEAMALLWERMVVDPVKQTQATTQPYRQALRSAYLAADVDEALIYENCRAHVGHQDARVDFAIANGHVVQLAHAFSFRRPTPAETVRRVKEWSWTIRDVRDRNGRILLPRAGTEPQVISAAVPIDVVHDDPDGDDGRRALDEAIEVLDSLEVTARSVRDVGLVARDAVDLLGRRGPGS